MPCNSDYLEPSSKEKALSKVAAFIDEIRLGKLDHSHMNGMHPRVYNKSLTGDEADKLVRNLCDLCKQIDNSKDKNIRDYSLELQIWWRDHKKADAKRARSEKQKIREDELRAEALKKLTPEERHVLGLD